MSAHRKRGMFNVSGEFFGPSDRVLIVDDFLASGQGLVSSQGLQSLTEAAHVTYTII